MITIRLKKFSHEEDDEEFDPHEHSAFRDYVGGALKGAVKGGIFGGALGGIPMLAQKVLQKDSLLRKRTGELALKGASKVSEKAGELAKFLKKNSKDSEICKDLYDKLGFSDEKEKELKIMKYLGKFPFNYIGNKKVAPEMGDSIANNLLPSINDKFENIVATTAILGGLNGIRKARKKRKKEEKEARELEKFRHYLLNE